MNLVTYVHKCQKLFLFISNPPPFGGNKGVFLVKGLNIGLCDKLAV